MTRDKMEHHLRHDCGMVKEACKLGCGEELTRNEPQFPDATKKDLTLEICITMQ